MSSRKTRRVTSGGIVENARFRTPRPHIFGGPDFEGPIFFHIPVAALRKKKFSFSVAPPFPFI